MKPAMTENEVVLLSALLRCTGGLLEFGSGGSTVLAAGLVRRSIVSVDSSRAWLDDVEAACRSGNLPVLPRVHFVDLGPIGHWGWPLDETRRGTWPAYHESVWETQEAASCDLCLVDGRFRVACCLQALLRAGSSTLVAIHDYATRPWYWVVEAFAEPVAVADALTVFRRRDGVEPAHLRAVLAEAAHDPR